ncbi:MAG: hypothetical protein HQL25_03765 [Candidatus Omnitrophica bacterium]|nr:hypothetical protein [Candidatus Omnitrophota bacterium]
MRHIKTLVSSIIFFVTISVPLSYAENVIHLKDGSDIKGQVLSLTNGFYTIKTDTLGELTVKSEDVANISNTTLPPQQTTPALPAETSAQMDQVKNQIMADPGLMQDIQALMNDKEIMQILQDPEFSKAVMNKDIQAVQNNPKTQELMNNPNMKKMMEKVGAKIEK